MEGHCAREPSQLAKWPHAGSLPGVTSREAERKNIRQAKRVNSPFRLQGTMARAPYIAMSIALVLLQYVVQGVVFAVHYGSASEFWNPWMVLPVSITRLQIWFQPRWKNEQWLLIPVLLVHATLVWLLLAAAIRRARSTGRSLLKASMVIVPFIQLAIIVWLSCAADSDAPRAQARPDRVPPHVALKGVAAGVILTLLLVAMSALVFRKYGSLLFLASPFLVGFVTAFIGNRHGDVGPKATTRLVWAACFLGGVGLLAIAIEGIVCLAMASPLIAIFAWLGGLAGRAVALKGPGGGRRGTAMSVALLPLFLAFDLVAPPRVAFENVESIEVAASDRAVWEAIVHMGSIAKPPAALFRWGLAYPMGGTLHAEGVGAIREGMFSTGVSYERVTEWEPGRRLSFIVLDDPPTMSELSPYRNVNAPHVDGYFRTVDTRLTITPLANGNMRLSSATAHELHLRPAFYWLPIAKWAIHKNKMRVLAHIAQQAEAAAAAEAARGP
jgi:hypothetical protein